MQFEEFLLNLNSRGIFPGLHENKEDFLKRSNWLKQMKYSEALQAFCLTEKIFNARPDWVEMRFEKKGLLPWEGAATWIDESAEHGRVSFIQIKPTWAARLYPQSEVIAHEMVHAMRMMFEGDRFEEILAFRTSKNRFRRYFGPLFNRPSESKGFILWMLSSWILYWADFIFELPLGAEYLLLSPILPLSWGIFRLMRSQSIFSRMLVHLKKAIGNPDHSLAVALRLSDQEIEQFSKSSPEDIISYAAKEKEKSLRWEQIYLSYFAPFFSLGCRRDL